MSLKSSFKTDSKAANEGVWMVMKDHPNADGTVPKFLMGRSSGQNKAYGRAARKIAAAGRDDDGVFKEDNLQEEEAEKLELDMFLDTLLFGWENFQPEDDGKDLAYTLENARKLFSDPSWFDLRQYLSKMTIKDDNYRNKRMRADAKNS